MIFVLYCSHMSGVIVKTNRMKLYELCLPPDFSLLMLKVKEIHEAEERDCRRSPGSRWRPPRTSQMGETRMRS